MRVAQEGVEKNPFYISKVSYAHSLSPVRLEGIQQTDNDTDPWGWENRRFLLSTLYSFELLDFLFCFFLNNWQYSFHQQKQ